MRDEIKVDLLHYQAILKNKFDLDKMPHSSIQYNSLKDVDNNLTIKHALLEIATDISKVTNRNLFDGAYDWNKLRYFGRLISEYRNITNDLKNIQKMVNHDTVTNCKDILIQSYAINSLINKHHKTNVNKITWSRILESLRYVTDDMKLHEIDSMVESHIIMNEKL